MKPLLFNTAEAAFLAGYLAAGMSKTGTVGTFGGLRSRPSTVFMDGFAEGVEKYNEDNGADVKVLGWDKKTAGRHRSPVASIDQTKGKTAPRT